MRRVAARWLLSETAAARMPTAEAPVPRGATASAACAASAAAR